MLLHELEEQKRLQGIVLAEAEVLSDKQCTCNSNVTQTPKEQVNSTKERVDSNVGFGENDLCDLHK